MGRKKGPQFTIDMAPISQILTKLIQSSQHRDFSTTHPSLFTVERALFAV